MRQGMGRDVTSKDGMQWMCDTATDLGWTHRVGMRVVNVHAVNVSDQT